MNATRCMVLGSFLAVLLGLFSATACAVSYTYTLIAQTGGVFSNVSAGNMNDLGTVAFQGSYTNGVSGIFAGTGGPITTIADSSGGTLMGLGSPSINDWGTVAFSGSYTGLAGCIPTTYSGILINNGTNISSVYVGFPQGSCGCDGDVCFPPEDISGPIMNNSGSIVFSTYAPYFQDGDFAEYAWMIQTTSGTVTQGNPDIYPFLGYTINNAGTVAFSLAPSCCPPEYQDAQVYTATSTGGNMTVIGTGDGPAINNLGTVAFFSTNGTLVIENNGSTTNFVNTSGPYSGYFSGPTINDSGTVCFGANLSSGGSGIFTSPNPAAGKVVAVGDPLFGSTITGLGGGQINNAGSVLFTAGLANGLQVIVRADPDLRPNPVFLSVINGVAALTFPTMPNVIYTVQISSDLVTGTWATTVGNIPGSGGVTNIFLPASGLSQQFYRIGAMALPTASFASDSAADPAYTNAWNNGADGGTGFGPWVLTATGLFNSTSNGFFIGSSTNNAFGTSPGIDVNGASWGLYANGGNDASAYRGFPSLPTGGVFSVNMDNGFIDSGNSVGFVLRNGNATTNYNTNARFEFLFLGGGDSYAVVDASGYYPIGVPFTGTGLRLVFTLGANDTYNFTVIDNASGSTDANITGTLNGTPGSTIDSVALYNRNAGSGTSNDAFFNSMQAHFH